MTRFLSQALGTPEIGLSQAIAGLEQAAGRPSADICLSAEIMQQTRQKITELGLDPTDTTARELYSALQERLRRDEQIVRHALGLAHDAAADEVIEKVRHYIAGAITTSACFALKASVVKRLLRAVPPKNVMRLLGYRSIESLCKHESPASLYAAAQIAEPPSWQKKYHEQYLRLRPADFEQRPLAITSLGSDRWQTLALPFVTAARHNIVSFPELGTIVLLPLTQAVDGLAITTLLLIVEHANAIRANSSFLKMQQVKPDFGKLLQRASASDPHISAQLAGQPVPWRMVQRYYARYREKYHAEIFEPHVQPEDFQWDSGEALLGRLNDTLLFWQGTETLGLLDAAGRIVSCNALDVALGFCNHLSFQDRIVHFVRDRIWHELMMRYLHQDNLEAALHRQLSAELGAPLAFAEEEAYN